VSKPYGASQEAWHHFASILGLEADLLPIVSNPAAVISKDSKLASIGKTPSIYNFRHEVAGIPKWTELTALPKDIARWEVEPDYGISIQCRTIRAIDIDVPDLALAGAITRAIAKALPRVAFPERHRAGTGKTLLAFRHPFPMPKRVIPVEGGLIEFLGDGQQFVAQGAHQDGTRYEWSPGLPTSFPELDQVELKTLWDTLCVTFATSEPTIARERRAPGESGTGGWTGGDDPVADYLMEHGHVLDQDREGRLFIICPWEKEHSSDTGATSTAYFPRNTGGYVQGHFACLHAHCQGREDREFREAIGYEADQFPLMDDSGVVEERAPAEVAAAKLPVLQIVKDFPKFERDGKSRIEPTYDNANKACERPDFCLRHIAFDKFTFGIVWAPFKEGEPVDSLPWRAWDDHDYVDLRIVMERRGFKPFGIEILRAIINRVAKYRSIDTAQEWLSRIEWDGKPRVERFMSECFGVIDTAYARAMGRYIWTGLAGRVLEPGVKADMVPIFKGPQGAGKSTAIEAMAPSEDAFVEINLVHRDDDTSRRLRGKLVAELGELRGLAARDKEDVKTFITRRKESWIPKYMEAEATFWRRLLFFGSTNQDAFLSDETGERRFLPIEIGTDHAIKLATIRRRRDQMWAEGAVLFLLGGVDFAEVETLAEDEHIRFKTVDSWLDSVAYWLIAEDSMTGVTPYLKDEGVAISEALEGAIGVKLSAIGRAHEMRMGALLRAIGARKVRSTTDGLRSVRYVIDEHNLAPWLAKKSKTNPLG
jgi:hypothetical protein